MTVKQLLLSIASLPLLAVMVQCASESGPDDSGETGGPEVKKYLSISLNSKEVDNSSGTFELNVTANCEWKAVTDVSWIKLSKDSAPRGEVIKVSYQANS
ncbi:MAG: BACON domain-containing protein, partial [Candidatus Cryptobacteroides sp.]